MRISTARVGGRALLQPDGRLDREGAEHLSDTLEDLLQAGVRSVNLDLSQVTYVSSAATRVLTRWRQELAILRGELLLESVSPEARAGFAVTGWDPDEAPEESVDGLGDLRRSSWHARADFARRGVYELSTCDPSGGLRCQLHGDPGRLGRAALERDDCSLVALPEGVFGLGVGAIGGSYAECRERMGELVAVGPCIASFPTDGARMADYLIGGGSDPPQAILASGLTCSGRFSHLIRFSAKPESDAVPLSELAAIALETAGGSIAGLVIAGETAGLSGTRLRRSPAIGTSAIHFEVPEIRDWLSFAPERTWAMTTTLVAGVVARTPGGPIADFLRPLDESGDLRGHLHAAVFSYHALPQRTVELSALLRRLFGNHQLRDVLHLLWDDRGETGVSESALVRGVAWVGPVTAVC